MDAPGSTVHITDGRPAGVLLFRVQMTILVALYTLLAFGGIYLLTRTFLLDSVRNQAASYASLVLDTRTWNASNGGVWVLKGPGVESNPYLEDLGIPADIETVDGQILTLRNHSTMTREISEISHTHRGVWFHLTALDFLNPTNAPDEWESAALSRIMDGETTVDGIDLLDGQRTYRYAERLRVDESCLECHRDQGYKVGDTGGAVTVNIPMHETDSQLRRAGVALAALGALTLSLSLLVMFYLTNRMQQRIEHANTRLETAAITDALTGVLNRGATLARLAEELERARRDGSALSVVMLDLDNFKRINDTYGHAAGDCALQEFVTRTRDTVRAYDVFGRIGGEEFLIVSPGTDAQTAYGLAFRVLEHLRSRPIGCDEALALTASAGIAEAHPGDERIDVLLARADAALYRAKDLGRDRAEVADRPE